MLQSKAHSNLTDQHKQLAALQEKEKKLSGQLLEAEMERDRLREDRGKEKKKSAEVQRQLVKAEKNLSSLQAEIDEKTAENLKVNTEKMNLELVKVGELETEIGGLKAKLLYQKQEITQLQTDLKASRECLRKLRAGDDLSVASSATSRSGGCQRSKSLLKQEQAKAKKFLEEIERLQATSDELKSQIKAMQDEAIKKDKGVAELKRLAQQKNGLIIGLKEQLKAEMTCRMHLQAQLDMQDPPPIGEVEFDSQNIENLSDSVFDVGGANEFKEVRKACPLALPTSPLAASAPQAPVQSQPIQEQAQDAEEEKMKVTARGFSSLPSPSANGHDKVCASDRHLITVPGAALVRKRKYIQDKQDNNNAPCDENNVQKLVVRGGRVYGQQPAARLLLTMESSTCELKPEVADTKRRRIEGAPLVIPAVAEIEKDLKSSERINPESGLGSSERAKESAASAEQDDINVLQDVEEID